jgi:lysophospholipase L1-like esterase
MTLRRTTLALGLLLLVLAACTPLITTSTTLTASASQVVRGQPITLTARVAAPSLPGSAPDGTVTFHDGSTLLGSAATRNGVATVVASLPTVGTRTLTARFTSGTGLGWGQSVGTRTVTVTAPPVHLALGDSLAAGAGAPAGQGYVPRITAAEAGRLPGLVLQNLACGGATTTSMLNGGGCTYPQGTQVAAAEAYLTANPGRVSFITIDIGANDVSGCVSAAGVDPTCAAQRIPIVEANLAQILARLRAAAPGVPIVGMTYYNPFLAFWVTGNEAAALSSNVGAITFNDALEATYEEGAALVAPVAEAFATEDTAMTGTFGGVPVPQNVANVCAWTRMCTNADIHANATGHLVIAAAFTPVIDAAVPVG